MSNKYVYFDLMEEFKKHEEFKDVNGDLLKSTIISKIKKLDEKTMSIILSFPEIKNKFTKNLNGITLLDQQSLISFFQSREFVNNSFTEYTNKIGLTNGLKFLDNSDEVVLDFPYKDCVLLGNQSREENEGVRQKFFHEVINFQEIERLFSKKVLCDFKRHTTAGIVEVTDFKDTDNLVIKGNNLIALHTIQKRFKGKVKLIYIDPPYNTESLKFAYNDKFDQATWLTFMKNRLDVAKELLREDGVIFISIDNKQQSYLKILCDDIFGSENFVTTIHLELSSTQGMKVGAAQNGNIVKNGEYIHIYSKNGKKNILINPLYDPREFDDHYSYYYNCKEYLSVKEKLISIGLISKEINGKISALYKSSDKIKKWILSEASNIYQDGNCNICFDDLDLNLINSESPLIFTNKQQIKYILIKTGGGKIRQLIPLSEGIGEADDFGHSFGLRKIRGDWWSGYFKDMGNISKEGDVLLENGKKPERLIMDIIKSTTKEKDIVLDYHLGSGTTCAVAHKMGRQYIGIEQLDYGDNDSIKRIENIIKGDSTGISKFVNWQGGGEFVSIKLFSLVEDILNQIKQAQSQEDVNKIIDLLLSEKYFYYLGIDQNKESYEEIFLKSEFKNKSIQEQKTIIHASIDKNNLYVDLNDLHDENVNISKEEKALNEKFYKDNK